MKSARATSELLRLPYRGARLPAPRGPRWLAIVEQRAEWLAAGLILALVVSPLGFGTRFVASAGVALGLGAMWVVRSRKPGAAPSGWVVVDELGIVRERDGVPTRLAEWGSQLGLVVFTSGQRDRGVLALTTLSATRYLPVRTDGPDDLEPARDLFARGASITDADLRPVLRDDEGALSAADATLFLSAVRARDPKAEGRIVLSDSRGAHVILEGERLYAGDRLIDLASPLEWRAFLFVEAPGAGAVASVVQATWVRQAGVEVVFVADAAREPSHPRGTRVSHPDAPPPLELRMSIERLFMAPLRSALDGAPRASRVPPPHAAVRGPHPGDVTRG